MFHDLYISPPRADRVLVLDTVSVFNKSVKTTIAVGIPRLGGARGAFQELKKRIQTVNLKWLILPLKDAVKKISRWAFSVFFLASRSSMVWQKMPACTTTYNQQERAL
jgi:hypothetical protein